MHPPADDAWGISTLDTGVLLHALPACGGPIPRWLVKPCPNNTPQCQTPSNNLQDLIQLLPQHMACKTYISKLLQAPTAANMRMALHACLEHAPPGGPSSGAALDEGFAALRALTNKAAILRALATEPSSCTTHDSSARAFAVVRPEALGERAPLASVLCLAPTLQRQPCTLTTSSISAHM
jgi:hypothetical protein